MKKLTLILALSLILAGCDGDSRDEKAEAEKERLEKEYQATAQRIQELCSQYNAVMDWTQSLEEVWSPFTIELEEALIRADSRPVLLLGNVKDIAKESDRYWAHFTLEAPYTGFDIHFFLHCTPEQVEEIMRLKLGDYAVIAQVSEVKKVSYVFEAYGEVETDFEGYPAVSVTIDPDPSSDLFIAKGTCSALLSFDVEGFFWSDLSNLLGGR